jgi:hypothetical protein
MTVVPRPGTPVCELRRSCCYCRHERSSFDTRRSVICIVQYVLRTVHCTLIVPLWRSRRMPDDLDVVFSLYLLASYLVLSFCSIFLCSGVFLVCRSLAGGNPYRVRIEHTSWQAVNLTCTPFYVCRIFSCPESIGQDPGGLHRTTLSSRLNSR